VTHQLRRGDERGGHGASGLSTLHTPRRRIDHAYSGFFKADEREQVRRQLAGTLRGVVCQRMVPTIDGKMTPALEIMDQFSAH